MKRAVTTHYNPQTKREAVHTKDIEGLDTEAVEKEDLGEEDIKEEFESHEVVHNDLGVPDVKDDEWE